MTSWQPHFKAVIYGELCCGKRTTGEQAKRLKNSLKVFLKDFNITTESWESLAFDRFFCCHLITKAAYTGEERRYHQADPKCATHKAEHPAPAPRSLITPVLPLLVSSAISRHTKPTQQPTRCFGHLRLRSQTTTYYVIFNTVFGFMLLSLCMVIWVVIITQPGFNVSSVIDVLSCLLFYSVIDSGYWFGLKRANCKLTVRRLFLWFITNNN